MKTQVKLFYSGYSKDLEDEMNKWLIENDVKIIDIKFASESMVMITYLIDDL